MVDCDRYLCELLGCKEYHRNFTDNFWEAIVESAAFSACPHDITSACGNQLRNAHFAIL